jgi:hypothetical protein
MIWGDNNNNTNNSSNNSNNILNTRPLFSNISNNGSQFEASFRKRYRFNDQSSNSITSPDEDKIRFSKKSHFGEEELIKSLNLGDDNNINSNFKSIKRTIFDENNSSNNNNEINQEFKKPNLSIVSNNNSFNMIEQYEEEFEEGEEEEKNDQNHTNLCEFNCIRTQYNIDLLNNFKIPKYSRKVDALIDNVIRKSSRSSESFPSIPMYATKSPGSLDRTTGSRGLYVREDFDSCIPNSIGPHPCTDHSISKYISNNNKINPHIKLLSNQNSSSNPLITYNNKSKIKNTHSGELTHTDWYMEEVEMKNEHSLSSMSLSDNEGEYIEIECDDIAIVKDLDFDHD